MMKRYPVVIDDHGQRPDFPEGESWPDDESIVGVAIEGKEYIFYEDGDVLPPDLKPSVRFLRDIPDDTVVWRYMPHNRFVNLLERQAIYFTPGYKLRQNEDYELRIPLRLAEMERVSLAGMYANWSGDGDQILKRIAAERWHDDAKYLCMKGISCWHINEVENHAMWQIYVGKDCPGVAIKSNVGRLKAAIDARKRSIHADKVTYIDYAKGTYEPHPSANGFQRIYSKSHFYSFENELRIVYEYPGFTWEYDDPQQRQALLELRPPSRFARTDLGHFLTNFPFVPVNLRELISDVVVRGVDGSSYLDEIKELAAKYLSSDTNVAPSEVYKWPDESCIQFNYDPSEWLNMENNAERPQPFSEGRKNELLDVRVIASSNVKVILRGS